MSPDTEPAGFGPVSETAMRIGLLEEELSATRMQRDEVAEQRDAARKAVNDAGGKDPWDALVAAVDGLGPDAPVEPVAAHVQADPDLPPATERALGNLVRAAADHPHTDPGDGRTECQPCGKYVWPVTHSCKGVPATDAARARAADGGDPR